MFTGIVEAACPLVEIRPGDGGRRLRIDLAPLRQRPPGAGSAAEPGSGPAETDLVGLGDSVAINGVCLTVAAREGDLATFDVIPETLAMTTLGRLVEGHPVNVERAMRFGDRVDGHLVQGHVQATGLVSAREEVPGELRLTVTCGSGFAGRCLPKGSVTLDGVSLTLAALQDEAFVVALVPHTLERTTLGGLAVGEPVNLEPDMIGQWVMAAVERMHGR